MRDETRTGKPDGAVPHQPGPWGGRADEGAQPARDESVPVSGYHYSVEWDTSAWGEAGDSE